jgi:predicted phosphodiesterase
MSDRPLCIASQLALDLHNQFPSAPTRQLAAMLYRDHPACFTDEEHARRLVRYHRGECGDKDRAKVAEMPDVEPVRKFTAPKSDAKPPVPYEWTHQGYGTIIADVHLPYHDERAFDTAINHAISAGATDFLLILGDWMDHYQLSRFSKDPRNRSFPDEVEMARDSLGNLAAVFGPVVYKLGNHERRYEDYMRMKAPQLLGLPSFEFSSVLGLEDAGVESVAWNSVIRMGDHLTVLHGHEFGRSVFNPVNPARGLFLRAKACAIGAHSHQTSQHDEPNVRGESLAAWSLGCLCDLHPEYASLNKWNHGFALLEYKGGDDWEVENKRIVNGKVR